MKKKKHKCAHCNNPIHYNESEIIWQDNNPNHWECVLLEDLRERLEHYENYGTKKADLNEAIHKLLALLERFTQIQLNKRKSQKRKIKEKCAHCEQPFKDETDISWIVDDKDNDYPAHYECFILDYLQKCVKLGRLQCHQGQNDKPRSKKALMKLAEELYGTVEETRAYIFK